MSLTRAKPIDGRSARRVLDHARNPAEITLHAARRYREEALKHGVPLNSDDIFSAQRAVRELCLHAKKIYRGKNSYILRSPPWFLFYRDGAVVTVLHERSQRRF